MEILVWESKYKCFLERTQNNLVYVKPCFVTPFGSNARQLRIKPRVQRVVHLATNWMGNWILMMIWKGLLSMYFCNFLFYWYPFLINCRKLFVNVKVFYLCIYSNLWIMEIYPNQWFWILYIYIILKGAICTIHKTI